MAVTVSQQPEDYTPGFNPQLFVALSTQVASANFVYTVEVTDLITSESIQYQIAKDPNDDRCYFDAMPFVENYLQNYVPINQYGWQRCTDASRKIRVNIGETYGATGSEILYPGSNIDYIVWNGVIDYLDFPAYDPADYVYRSNSTTNLVYLSSRFNDTTYSDRSNYFYALTSEAGDILNVQITTYDSSGIAIGTSTIANPYEAGTTYTNKYLSLDVGPKGLTNISSGAVTGTYPIITNSVASYDIVANCITGSPAAGEADTIRSYTISDECRYDVYTVHFLAKTGAFETIQFSKRSDVESSRQEATYKVTPYTKTGGTMTYARSAPLEKNLSSGRTTKITLNTDWLDQDQIDLYEQILDSPVIYLDEGSALSYARLKLITDTYKVNKRYNERLFQLTMTFQYSHANYRQR